ncbi:hypothetical protein [Taibaiella chishuiensis]|uniref:Uncharacterized protein n=1 Tax=Taibaiella chishuiensis TaxID=1434707 RepID=A0A2P8D0N3_9BACT|nr:hypothetical protein [Taibaiella chishuiensis]PSK90773.1 hypothetical protein B0I18_107185 [Taibaiella chishuiensis]
MKSKLDILERELSDLTEKEARYEKMFGKEFITSPAYLKDKIGRFESLQSMFGNSGGPEDRLALIGLRVRQDKVVRQLYPGFLRRLIYQTFKNVFSAQRNAKLKRAEAEKVSSVLGQARKAGFSGIGRNIEQQIKMGNREFIIPVSSHYVTANEKMEFQIKFKKDDLETYQIESYQATYRKLGEHSEIRSCIFHDGLQDEISTKQAHNLLAGRSVQVNGRGWIQLDFTDKDAEGNFKLKEFPLTYGYDVSKCVKALSLSTKLDPDLIEKLVLALKDGERIAITDGEVKVELEANPQKNEVMVFKQGILDVKAENWKKEINKTVEKLTENKAVDKAPKKRGVRV